MTRGPLTAPPEKPGGGDGLASRRRDPALEARYRQLHAQIVAENRPVSGRAGRYFYYWAYGHLCWRVDVVPKDPRTAAQRRCRAAFAAASRAWSQSEALTQEQRDVWRAQAGKFKSRPRLGQSGPLTGQQHYVPPPYQPRSLSRATPLASAVATRRRHHHLGPIAILPAPSPQKRAFP